MSNSQTEPDLVCRLTLADLPGAMRKSLPVPPGHIGLVVDGKGRTRTLSAGQHVVIGPWRRLFGRVSDWEFAVLLGNPFPLLVPLDHLRAGDGEWVDVTCAITAQIADPARFYAQRARGQGGSAADLAQHLSMGVEAAVRQAVSGWAGSDLVRGALSDRLAAEVRRALASAAEPLGLSLQVARYVAVRPSGEAVEVARKRAELEAALADVEMERRMGQLAGEAEWQAFLRQLEADYALPGLAQEVTAPHAQAEGFATTTPNATSVRAALQRYADASAAGLGARLRRLDPKRERRQPPVLRWWERVVPWLKVISALILVASLALYLASPRVSTRDKIAAGVQLALAVPSAIVLFLSALWLERQATRERARAFGGGTLAWLGRGHRERIDRLVRDQLGTELAAIAGALLHARDRAYQDGHREEALAIKPVQERADRLRQEVAAGAIGAAPYLAAPRLSDDDLAAMLNADEELLAQASELSGLAQQVRQSVLAGTPGAELGRRVETGLSDLDHRLQTRSRIVPSAADSHGASSSTTKEA